MSSSFRLTYRLASALFVLTLAAVALAADFSGTFTDAQTGVSLSLRQNPDGTLQGTFSGSGGQFALQGQASDNGAYGAISTTQGPVGFQAQLSPDGQTLQLALYAVGPNGQPTPQGAQLVLRRTSTPPTGPAGTGVAPPPGGAFPPQPPTNPPSTSPFEQSAVGVQWNGTFVGDGGQFVMVVQTAPGGYEGYLEVAGQRYPFQAHLDDLTLHGGFQVNGAAYEFWADRDQGMVYLLIGDTEYLLEPVNAAPGQGAPPSNPFGN